MKAGRELDALIAEKVMGLKVGMLNEVMNGAFKPQYDELVIDLGRQYMHIPHYSTNIADAWLVVEKLQENKWEVVIESRSYQTEVKAKNRMGGWVDMYGTAETAPLAICLAALRCKGIGVE